MSKYSFLSTVLKVAGSLGFLLHILTIAFLIIVRPIWVGAIQNSAAQAFMEIEDIEALLSLTEGSLSLASEVLRDTSDMLVETGEFIQDSNTLLRSAGTIIGEEAPMTIQSTHDAIEAAQSGSQAVDTMLRALSVLEPVTGFAYDPEKSLSQSLEEVADGLKPLPESLRVVQSQLNQVADEINEIHPSLDVAAQDLARFSENIAEFSSELELQVERLDLIQNHLQKFREGVAAFGWISTIILCTFLVLGAVSYISVFCIGNQLQSGQEDENLS